MPTYEYKCPKCGKEFELFQKITSRPGAKCPKCGAKAERQLSAGAGLVFKGSGFYLTDYGRSGQKARSDAADGSSGEKSGDKSAETKSESKSDAKAGSKSESKSGAKADAKPAKSPKKAE